MWLERQLRAYDQNMRNCCAVVEGGALGFLVADTWRVVGVVCRCFLCKVTWRGQRGTQRVHVQQWVLLSCWDHASRPKAAEWCLQRAGKHSQGPELGRYLCLKGRQDFKGGLGKCLAKPHQPMIYCTTGNFPLPLPPSLSSSLSPLPYWPLPNSHAKLKGFPAQLQPSGKGEGDGERVSKEGQRTTHKLLGLTGRAGWTSVRESIANCICLSLVHKICSTTPHKPRGRS